MAVQTNTFKGARYVPKFADPIEWSAENSYEAIESVQHNGFTYLSKQPVPVGVEITNTEFWLEWADPNAQMEQLRQDVAQYAGNVEELGGTVGGLSDDLTAEIANREAADNTINGVIGVIEQIDGKASYIVNDYVDSIKAYCVGVRLPKNAYTLAETLNLGAFNDAYIKSKNGFGIALSVLANFVSNGVAYTTSARTTGWGYLGFKNGNIEWIEDYGMAYNANNIANMGYENAFLTFQPLVINDVPYDFSLIPDTAPEYDYVLNEQNARMVFGWDSDSYYLIIVDDRTPFSNGVTSEDLRTFVIGLGIENAVNCDGGGSTQLWWMPEGYNMAHVRNPVSPAYSKPNKTRSKPITVFTFEG